VGIGDGESPGGIEAAGGLFFASSQPASRQYYQLRTQVIKFTWTVDYSICHLFRT
jgi:hypothetical protein